MVRCPIGKDVVIIGLQIWLPLNGNLNNHGLQNPTITNTGATISNNGKIGKCYAFDGSNDYMQIGYGQGLTCNNLTITMWIKPLASLNDKIVFGVSNGNNQRLYIGIAANTYNIAFGSTSWGRTTNASVKQNTWQFLAVVINNNICSLYCDGIFVESLSVTNSFSLSSNFFVGGRNDGFCANTLINDVRIYNHAVSIKELKLIQQCLVLHYPMGSIDGKIAGRNLLRKPTTENGSLFGSMSELKTKTFSGWDFYGEKPLVDIDWNNHVGEYLTYRCYVENVSQTIGTGTGIMLHFFYTDNTYTQYGGGKNGVINSFLTVGEKGYLTITAQIPDPSIRSNPTTIKNVHASIRHNSTDGNSTVNFKEAKVELGNKPTPWTPAPEDVPQWYNNIIYDTSGYMNNGTVTDAATPMWDNDSPRYSGSYSFDGNTSYITVSSNINSIIKGSESSLSFSFWFKPADTGRNVIFGDYNTSGSINFNIEYDSNGVRWYWGSSPDKYFSMKIAINTWVHICLVYTGTAISIYKNGALTESYVITLSPKTKSSGNFLIGKDSRTGETMLNGGLSDFRIYATPLSAYDIESLYKTSASVTKNGTLLLAGEVVE